MSRLFLPVFALVLATGCELDDACDRLATYVCTCHTDEDCDSYQDLAVAPSSAVVDECLIELADAKAADQDAGVDCGVE